MKETAKGKNQEASFKITYGGSRCGTAGGAVGCGDGVTHGQQPCRGFLALHSAPSSGLTAWERSGGQLGSLTRTRETQTQLLAPAVCALVLAASWGVNQQSEKNTS